MLRKNTKSKTVIAVTLLGLIGAMMLYGCKSNETASTLVAVAPAATQQDPAFALWGPPPKRSGVQLWSDTCARCHNMRPPSTFSDAQWATVVHHMRLRANLTGEEAREITAFLQASNH
jgi:hypothetical protein